MSTPDRTTIVKGAGAVKIASTQIYAKGEIEAKLNPESFEILVAGYGALDQRLADAVGSIVFTPSGRITADILSALYPYSNPTIDASIFGAADTATEVHSIVGQKMVFHNTALKNMPSLKLSARQTTIGGNVEIAFIPKNATDRSTANSTYTGPTATPFTPDISVSDIKTLAYTALWDPDGTPVAITTKDGWDIDFDVQVEPFSPEDYGTIDMYLKSVSVLAKCTPLNFSEDILSKMLTQGAGAVIGGTMRESKNLTISAADGITLTMQDVSVVEGPCKWGEGMLRAGQLGFKANRSFSSSAPSSLFAISMTA
jgi:hypothetical protein